MRTQQSLLAILILATTAACAPAQPGSSTAVSLADGNAGVTATSNLAKPSVDPLQTPTAPTASPSPSPTPALGLVTNSAPLTNVNELPSNAKPVVPAAPAPVVKTSAQPVVSSANSGELTSVNGPSNKPLNKPLNKPANKPANKPVEKTADKPVTKPEPKPAPTSSNDEDVDYSDIETMWYKKKEADLWTGITVRALDTIGDEMLKVVPTDIKYYCPRFAKLERPERLEFYVQLISSLASHESSLREHETYTESFVDSSNTKVVSRGLLQISKEAANLYGCKVEDGTELMTAVRNIRCGVRIMSKWVVEDGVIAHKTDEGKWRGAARYWAPFRHPRNRPRIQADTLKLEFCHPPAKAKGDRTKEKPAAKPVEKPAAQATVKSKAKPAVKSK